MRTQRQGAVLAKLTKKSARDSTDREMQKRQQENQTTKKMAGNKGVGPGHHQIKVRKARK